MRTADADAVILPLARAQHGIVTRWQLAAAGIPCAVLDDRLKRGRLSRVTRRVYRVPGLEGPCVDVIAAVFGYGPFAAASHDTAGVLHGYLGQPAARFVVSAWRGHPDRRDDVVLHRVLLPADERVTCDGVPATSPARTLLDLAATLPNRTLEQALARGLRSDRVTCDEVLSLIARYPRRPGSPRLRALLATDEAPALTRSQAEERFLALVRTAELPRPVVNVMVHGFEADFHWPAHGVVVEIDGLAYHATRDAQQRDRRRDSSLGAAGLRVLRFTWADLTVRPTATLAKVAMALGRVDGGPSPGATVRRHA